MKEGGSKGELGGRKEAGRRPIVGLQQTVRRHWSVSCAWRRLQRAIVVRHSERCRGVLAKTLAYHLRE